MRELPNDSHYEYASYLDHKNTFTWHLKNGNLLSRPEVIFYFSFMPNSAERGIFPAHKC